MKQRVQQDEMRRAKKREDQLQELSQGRFKKSLSLPEKKCAAERERIKGNESFKASEVIRFFFRHAPMKYNDYQLVVIATRGMG